jgi:muconate cycloisomerase
MGWTGRRTPEDAAQKAFEAMQKGHKVFKFKCSDEDPVRLWTEEIRKKCGDGIKVLLDPNQRWNDVETTIETDGRRGSRKCMLGLEDPVLHEDIEGFQYLKKHLGVPLYRHISLPYTQDIRDMIAFVRADAVDGYNFNGSAFNSCCWRRSRIWKVSRAGADRRWIWGFRKPWVCTLRRRVSIVLFRRIFSGNWCGRRPASYRSDRFSNGAALVPQGDGLGITLDLAALKNIKQANTYL